MSPTFDALLTPHPALLFFVVAICGVSFFSSHPAQLSTDDGGGDGSCISVVERADPLLNSVDTVCSLYEV